VLSRKDGNVKKLNARHNRKSKQKKREELEKVRKAEEEKARLEQLERKKKEDEERKKRLEEEVNKKMEEDRKRMEERRKKIAELRKQQLEEERRKKEEEERKIREQEELRRQMELEKLMQEMQLSNKIKAPTRQLGIQQEEEFDLLGGLPTEEYQPQQRDDRLAREHQIRNANERGFDGQEVSTKGASTHRSRPQRGPIDASADSALDTINVDVPISKQGNADGVYVFGGRMMKMQFRHGTIAVVLGAKEMSVSDFVGQYEKTERVRLRGLKSAIAMCSVIGSGISPI